MTKIIKDNIHGYIEISDLAVKIIDTPEFQRLRRIKQTSSSFYVFPSLVHSRFEHSIGVYHLTGLMIENIDKKIDERLMEIIKIAGLCHDIGHMAYSHTFDHHIIPRLKNKNKLKDHEYRSCLLIRHMIDKYNLDISDLEYDIITHCINGKKHDKYEEYLFRIVCNSQNGIDSDKLDYLLRDSYYINQVRPFDLQYIIKCIKVIDNELCFDKNCLTNIYKMFSTRYTLHCEYYQHKAAVGIEVMIKDIFLENKEELNLEDLHTDFKWLKITDDVIYHVKNMDLIDRIERRDIYKTCLEIEDNEQNYEKVKRRFSFSSVKECFKNIYFYNRKDMNKKFKIDKLPDTFPRKNVDSDILYVIK